MKKRIFLLSLFAASTLLGYNMEVTPGWQLKGALVKIPVQTFDVEGISSIWTYDKSNNRWRAYFPNNPTLNENLSMYNIEPLECIEQGEGFWLAATENVILTIDENVSSLPITLSETNTTLNEDQRKEVAWMWNEEKLAHDLYLDLFALYSSEPAAKPLYNIATKSETQHMQAVLELGKKYDVNLSDEYLTPFDENLVNSLAQSQFANQDIQALYDQLYEKGSQSLKDALEVGCIVEVTDVDDLNIALDIAGDNQDLVDVFTFLRQGSYDHYWAFDRALKNMGVAEGCCSLGEAYCRTPEEYPSNNGAQGGGQSGIGHGRG